MFKFQLQNLRSHLSELWRKHRTIQNWNVTGAVERSFAVAKDKEFHWVNLRFGERKFSKLFALRGLYVHFDAFAPKQNCRTFGFVVVDASKKTSCSPSAPLRRMSLARCNGVSLYLNQTNCPSGVSLCAQRKLLTNEKLLLVLCVHIDRLSWRKISHNFVKSIGN